MPIQIALLLGAAWIGRLVPYESYRFWACYFAIVPAVAWPVHHWYERPMRSFLRRRFGAVGSL
ncbi:MAG: hypothetical protein WDN69_33785 [Aliidongia sp.]